MATKIAPAEPPAPAHIEPTKEHRAFAKSRGSDLTQLLALLKSGIGDVTLLLREIIASAPDKDESRAAFAEMLARFEGELSLLGP